LSLGDRNAEPIVEPCLDAYQVAGHPKDRDDLPRSITEEIPWVFVHAHSSL
jgi:hypothetical protein